MNFYILAVIFAIIGLIAMFAMPAMGFTFFVAAFICLVIAIGARHKKK